VVHEIIKDQLKSLDDVVVGEAFLTHGNTFVTDTIEQIRTARPDLILNNLNGDTNIAFFRELRDAGITSDKTPTLSFRLAESELVTMNHADVGGDYAAQSYFQSLDRPENRKFLALLNYQFPAQQVADDPMATAYSSVYLWAQAVQKAGSDDPAEIRAALAQQSFDGPGGRIEIDPETQHAHKPTLIGQIQADGQFEIKWSSDKPLRPIPFPASRSREKWESLLVSLQAGWGGHWTPTARNIRAIKVGVLHSISGTMATSESGVVDATLMAIDELNAKGGVLGRPVESVFADGKSDSVTFRDEAERLIRDEKVCTVFGCWTSASRKTVVPVIEQANNLLIYPVQYEGLEQSPNVFYLGATPNQQILPAVHWCAETLKSRRFFLIGSDYIFPRAANELIREEIKLIGGEVVGEEYRPLGNSTFLPTIAKILEAKPDVILNTINGSANVDFFQKLREKGITPDKIPTVSFSISERGFSAMRIADVVGTYAAWNYFQSVDRPENQRFIKELRAKYYRPLIVTDPMEAAYAGVHLWAQAVEEARSDKPLAIREALRRQTFDGPSGMFQFNPATQHASKTARIGRLQANNQFEIVWSSPTPIPAIVFPPSRTPEQWKSFLDELYQRWGNHWEAGESADQ
jgi:urea transport system substrate-binding protein